MTSEATETAADDGVAAVATVAKAPRRFPPPCWTQEETLGLIEAYRERWYALRRGYLRTADWDAVAAAVSSRCPGASPAKTSAQCRHKMEKLRQRYRAEKQRALSFPSPGGRYFSSWFFFDNMEAMENGTAPPTAVHKPENSSDGPQLKSFLDQNIVKLKLKAKSNADSSPDSGYDNTTKPKRSNSAAKTPIDHSAYSNTEIPDKLEEEIAYENDLINLGRRQQLVNGISIPIPIQIPKPTFRSKSKNSVKVFNAFDIKNLEKYDPSYNRRNPIEEFWVKIPNSNHINISNSLIPKYWDPNSNSRAANHGLKRGKNAVEEIVESIKLLGEGFMKVEAAKMEMAREMEAVRMEMEMKRNEMLIESQKQIVDAFLKGLFEFRKSKKAKTAVVAADSAEQ